MQWTNQDVNATNLGIMEQTVEDSFKLSNKLNMPADFIQKGDTGEQGPQGDPGIQGEKGAIGPVGDKGDNMPGMPGETGDPGENGDIGPQGDPGLQGETGAPGLSYNANNMVYELDNIFMKIKFMEAYKAKNPNGGAI